MLQGSELRYTFGKYCHVDGINPTGLHVTQETVNRRRQER